MSLNTLKRDMQQPCPSCFAVDREDLFFTHWFSCTIDLQQLCTSAFAKRFFACFSPKGNCGQTGELSCPLQDCGKEALQWALFAQQYHLDLLEAEAVHHIVKKLLRWSRWRGMMSLVSACCATSAKTLRAR